MGALGEPRPTAGRGFALAVIGAVVAGVVFGIWFFFWLAGA
jgi:hypothetical protein